MSRSAQVRATGTAVGFGDEVAVIETIKVNISLVSPLAGVAADTNPAMSTAPEAINQDPYGAGWLADLEATDWEAHRLRLLNAEAYFRLMKGQAEEEAKKL